MSTQQIPTTFEQMMALFHEDREQMREIREEMLAMNRKTDLQFEKTNKLVGALGSRLGEIIECMVEGGIVDKFQALGYEITQCARSVKFGSKKSGTDGQVDLFLENGEIAILIEVKTTLETSDVRRHIERLKKYRRYADAKGDKRRFIGAVAGAVIEGESKEFALESGMYVIVQAGDLFEIIPSPEGFVAKEW
jgi:hypothetical protein